MSDLTYTVEIKGIQDVDKFGSSIEKLTGALNASKGSGKGLEEMRKILVGLKGKSSVFEELRDSMRQMATASSGMSKTFKDAIGGLSGTIKSEMAVLRGVMNNAAVGMGAGFKDGAIQGLDQAEKEVVRKTKTVAAKTRAEMTAAYDKLVGGDGFKSLGAADMGLVSQLQKQGAAISGYHREIIKGYNDTYKNNVKTAEAEIALRERVVSSTESSREKQLAVDRRFQSAQDMIDAKALAQARKHEQEIARIKNTFGNYQNTRAEQLAKQNNAQLAVDRAFEAAQASHEQRLVVISEKAEAQLVLAREKELQVERKFLNAQNANHAKELAQVQKHEQEIARIRSTFAATRLQQAQAASSAETAFNMKTAKSDSAVRALLGLPTDTQVNSAFGGLKSQMVAQYAAMDKLRNQYANPSGVYSGLSDRGLQGSVAQLKAFSKVAEEVGGSNGSAGKLNKSFQMLTLSGNDVHSMARGLASGFNLLWLTWGNLVPLFAGAAISNGFVQTAKSGMQVAHTLSVIENIGGNTKDQMVELRNELVRLGNAGPFAPTAIAEAMQTLSLAGLKANEIIRTTQDVLNFSVAGTTSIQTAADTLVSVATAFDMGAQGFGRISDVISKAAAESKSSVESFANAMKLASVISAQYGVTLEDTATAIAAMSQLGIQGTSAGTALRNMYADLSGRSIKVTKILKEQGLELRNTATGGFKPMLEVVAELSDKFATMTAVGQKNLISALMSERGGKAIVEMLRLINSEAKDTSKSFSNALVEMRTSIEESYGFAAVSAAKLSQSTQSLFQQMGATLKTSMFQAYEGMEPTLALIARDLKAVFGSEEFKSDLAAMTKFVAEFGRSLISVAVFLADNAGLVLAAGAAYKAFAIAAGMAAAAQVAATAATAADTAANVANAASQAGKLTGIAAFARFLPGIGIAVGVAAAAWALYDATTRDATASSLENARAYTTNVVKTLEDQTNKIAALNQMRREGLTLTEAQARLDGATSAQKALDPYAQSVNTAIKEELAARAELQNRRETYAAYSAKDNKNRVTEQERVVAQLAANTRKLKAEELSAAEEVNAAVSRGAAERKEAARLDAIDFQTRQKAREKFGDVEYSQAGTGKPFGGKTFERADLDRTNDLKAIQNHFDQRLSVAKDAYDREKKIMDARRSGELISETEYMSSSYSLATNYEEKQLALLEASNTAYLTKYAERFAKQNEEMKAAKSKETKGVYADLIEKEQNDLLAQTDKNVAAMIKIRAEAAERIQLTYISLESTAGKLIKTDSEFWSSRARSTAAEKAAKDLEKAYSNINTSIFSNDQALYAQAQAQARVAAEVDEHNAKLREQLRINLELVELAKLELEFKSQDFSVGADELARQQALIQQMETAGGRIRKTLDESSEKGLKEGAEAGFRAFEEQQRVQANALRDEVADAIVQGITGDAKAAGKALRDILQRELLTKPLTAFIKGALSMDGTQTGTAEGGVSGAFGGLMNTMSSIYGAFTGGSSASAGAAVMKMGETFGSEAMKAFATGMKGSTLAPGLAGPTTGGAGGMMGAGAVAGTVLNVVGGVGAGLAGGKLVSGGYSAFGSGSGNSAVNTGTAIGAAVGSIIPVIGTALGAVIGGLIGGSVNRLFGTKLAGSGIEGTFGGDQGFAGNQYQFFKGGVFRSDKTKTSELDPETTRSFGATFKGLQVGTAAMAATLGLGTEAIKNFTTTVKLDLKDLSEDEASKKIGEEFDKIAEALAQTALAGTGYISSMETAVDTLTRLSQGLVGVNGVFELLGVKIYENSLQGAGLAQVLIAAAGGLEAFTTSTQAYYDAFYSESERMDKQRELQMKALSDMGLYMEPAQGDAAKKIFRDTVTEALNTGQVELAAKLLGMATAFAEVADYGQTKLEELADKAKETWATVIEGVEKLAKSAASLMVAADNARKSAGDLLDKISEAMGGSSGTYAALREQKLWAAMAEADYETQIDLAGQLTDIVLSRHQLEKENAETLLDFGKSLKAYVDSLKIGSLSPLTTGEKLAEAARQYQSTLAAAKGGDSTAMGALQGAASSYLELAREYFASSTDYTNIFNSVTGALDALGASAQSEAQQQLEVSGKSLEQLRQLQTVVQAAYGKADTEFNVQRVILQEQVNQLLRTAAGIEAVRDILSGLPSALAGQINAGGVQNSGRYSTLAQTYVNLLGGKGGSPTDVNYVAGAMGNLDAATWKVELSNALSLLSDPSARQQMQAIFDAIASMKGINGSHANGLSYVPFDNYIAQLHKGERVLTAGENKSYNAINWNSPSEGLSDSVIARLTSQLDLLTDEVVELRIQNREDAGLLAQVAFEASESNAEKVVTGVANGATKAAWGKSMQKNAEYN